MTETTISRTLQRAGDLAKENDRLRAENKDYLSHALEQNVVIGELEDEIDDLKARLAAAQAGMDDGWISVKDGSPRMINDDDSQDVEVRAIGYQMYGVWYADPGSISHWREVRPPARAEGAE